MIERDRARRRWRGARRWCAALGIVCVTGQAEAQGRQHEIFARAASEAYNDDVLGRLIDVRMTDVPLEVALRLIANAGRVRLSYSSDLLPPGRRVTVERSRASVGEVLREVLRGTPLEPVTTPSGYIVLVRLPGTELTEIARNDSAGAPNDSVATLMPRDGIRPQLMDRVLVTGTPVAGASGRGLAHAVTVLSAEDIERLGPTSMQDLFRTSIPGIVAWNLGVSGPLAQLGSVRGSSSFTSTQLKTYIDGVELASPYLLFAIDPSSVERIEVIRGPQGSALYGSDAISGVVQVVTRKGRTGSGWTPLFEGALSGGVQESRYVNGTGMQQKHTGRLSLGQPLASLGIGGSYHSADGVIPDGSSGYRSAFAGGRRFLGSLRLDAFARYADVRFTAASNPLLRPAAINAAVRPILSDQRIEHETFGATVDHQLHERWRHSLVLGVDRNAGAIPAQREPATVADALLGATQERVSRASARYSTSLRTGTDNTNATFTVGIERSVLERERFGFTQTVSGIGSGQTALYFDRVANSGAFGQVKFAPTPAWHLTAGLRGERNSSFGPNVGTAWSPMLGVAHTKEFADGRSALKLRAAYGKGIRPPPPSARRRITTVTFRQIENNELRPEEQSGIEYGAEWYVGDRLSLSLTAYRQNADELIQQVVEARAVQYQNVGRIDNVGAELETTARFGLLRASATMAWTDSKVRRLAPNYNGDLRVGDQVPEVPGSSGQAWLSYDLAAVRLTGGATYIGSWTGYDWIEYYNAAAGISAERPLRGYWMKYPALVKPFAMLEGRVAREAALFLRVDNLSNKQLNERDNLQITAGRSTTLGLKIGR
ncbi:MAG TPA: TonB-dependent receptor [Gemmatimonadaceae bacterium]|nr:TonB-dependent receptor [Gemmatimonadaceae bacterium]